MKDKKRFTKKQHYISHFILKKWSKGKKLAIYNKTDDNFLEIKNIYDRKNEPNIYWRGSFYESDSYPSNYIEDGLGKLENEVSNIYQKIITSKNDIQLTRLELKLIKLSLIISSVRSIKFLEDRINLNGDSFFNEIHKDKSMEDNIKEQHKILDYLLYENYEYMHNEIGYISNNDYLFDYNDPIFKEIDKHKPTNEKQLWEAFNFIIKNNKDFQNIDKYKNNPFLMTYTNLLNIMKESVRILKIDNNLKVRFILSDNRHVQLIDPKSSNTLMTIMPISPEIALGFLKLNFFNPDEASIFAKDSFWDNMFPGLLKKNVKQKYKNENIFIQKEFSTLEEQVKYYTNEDKYIYKKYIIKSEEQINLLNGMLLSQTNGLIAFKDKNDLSNAKEAINKYGIHRIEETR